MIHRPASRLDVLTVIVLAFSVAACGGAELNPAPAPAGMEAREVVAWRSGGWRYLVGAHGHGAGFEGVGFSDADWRTGAAGFGTETAECASGQWVRTAWPLGTDLLLRREIDLPAGARGLRIEMMIDNDAQLFVNGVDLSDGFRSHDGCADADPPPPLAVPDELLRAGRNVIAVRARDRGVISYFDLHVTVVAPR